jgi:hypothetical protein
MFREQLQSLFVDTWFFSSSKMRGGKEAVNTVISSSPSLSKKTASDVIGKGASFLNLSGAGRTARHLEFLPEPVDML